MRKLSLMPAGLCATAALVLALTAPADARAAPSGSGRARAFAPRRRAVRPGASRNAASIGKLASRAAAGRANKFRRNAASPNSKRAPSFERFRALFHRLLGGDPSEAAELVARPGELPLGVMASVELRA